MVSRKLYNQEDQLGNSVVELNFMWYHSNLESSLPLKSEYVRSLVHRVVMNSWRMNRVRFLVKVRYA